MELPPDFFLLSEYKGPPPPEWETNAGTGEESLDPGGY